MVSAAAVVLMVESPPLCVDDQHPHCVVGFYVFQTVTQLINGLVVRGVSFVRAVQRQLAYVGVQVFFQAYALVTGLGNLRRGYFGATQIIA